VAAILHFSFPSSAPDLVLCAELDTTQEGFANDSDDFGSRRQATKVTPTQLQATWAEPSSFGSPIRRYEAKLSIAPGPECPAVSPPTFPSSLIHILPTFACMLYACNPRPIACSHATRCRPLITVCETPLIPR
jgi:hypothetical protein